MDKPDALWLADELDAEPRSAAHHDAAAAELRRLHDIEKAYASACELIDEQDKKLVEIERQRDALLEALKLAKSIIGHPDDAHSQMIDAAIKAVEEGQ